MTNAPRSPMRVLRAVRQLIGRPAVKLVGICVVAAGLLGSVILQSVNLADERRTYSFLLTTNDWAVAQLELELVRFLGSLDAYAASASRVSHDDLVLRFDIFWSRVPHLAKGPETAEFRQIKGANDFIADLLAALKRVDAQVQNLKAGDREGAARIRSALAPFLAPAHEFTLQLHNGPHFKAIARRLKRSHDNGFLLQGAMVAIAALVVVMLVFEVRKGYREAARARAARDVAEAASRSKSVFLANMGHELRTPLNAIIGFSEIQLHETFGPLPQRNRGYTQHIHDSARHLLSVVNDVLDMAKVDAGTASLTLEVFDPAGVLEACLRSVAPLAAERGLRVVHGVPSRPIELVGDRLRFRQIALHLLSNAVKFTASGGWVQVDLWVGGQNLHLRVTDNGPGIPPEVVQRVTEPFEQADQRLAREFEGSGLGLALVKAFAGLHGGTLSISNRDGGGISAEVSLPRVRYVDTTAQTEDDAPERARDPIAAVL